MTLPFPTGHTIELQNSEYSDITNFVNKYRLLFEISEVELKPEVTKKLKVRLKKLTISDYQLLSELLKVKSIPIYKSKTNKNKIAKLLGVSFDNVDNVFDYIKDTINKHNTYLDDMSQLKVTRIHNNYLVNSLYLVSSEAVNLTQALTSVDTATEPLKQIAAESEDAQDAIFRCAGNSANKCESISENLTGGDCIGISAVGLKDYFGIQQYENILLNEGDPDAQMRILGQDISILIDDPSHSKLIIAPSAGEAAKYALGFGGIDTLRHPDENGMHFGNPFTHSKQILNAINVGSVKKAVELYEAWLLGESKEFIDENSGEIKNVLDIEPERRQWIASLIKSGALKGKPLIYYTNTIPDTSYNTKQHKFTEYDYEKAPNHAHILQRYINNGFPKDSIIDLNDPLISFNISGFIDNLRSIAIHLIELSPENEPFRKEVVKILRSIDTKKPIVSLLEDLEATINSSNVRSFFAIDLALDSLLLSKAGLFMNERELNSHPIFYNTHRFVTLSLSRAVQSLVSKLNVHKLNLYPNLRFGNLHSCLVNIRAKNPDTITNEDVKELLYSIRNKDDAAIVLSALLSLSTDNAKDLGLAKLNATSTMIGMYIYGISIGMDFRDISKILMSDTAKILANSLKGDVFSQEEGEFDVSRAIELYEKLVPWSKLLQFTKMPVFEQGLDAPLWYVNNVFKRVTGLPFIPNTKEPGYHRIKMPEDLRIFEEARRSFKSAHAENVKAVNQVIDILIEHYYNASQIDKRTLSKIEKLAKGGEEMRKIGQRLGLNQGLKTDLESLINIMELFPGADIMDIAFNKEKRKELINLAEHDKVSFNSIDMIDKLPHFEKYVQLLALLHESCMNSARYKFVSYMALDNMFRKKLGISKKDIIKAADNYASWYLTNLFLSTVDSILIPSGNKAFNPKGQLNDTPLSAPLQIQLGKAHHNATFRRWMETEVIPNLQQGITRTGGISGAGIMHNLFIRDLTNDVIISYPSGNESIIYKLPITMIARTDFEKSLLDDYRESFTLLDCYSYNGIPVRDLFILYDMVVHNNKLSESSLGAVFKDIRNTGLLKLYTDFISDFDKNGNIEINGVDEFGISNAFYAMMGSRFNTNAAIKYTYNEDTEQYDFKLTSTDDYFISDIDRFMYAEDIDTNYFPNLITETETSDYAIIDNPDNRITLKKQVVSGEVIYYIQKIVNPKYGKKLHIPLKFPVDPTTIEIIGDGTTVRVPDKTLLKSMLIEQAYKGLIPKDIVEDLFNEKLEENTEKESNENCDVAPF